MTTEPLSSCSIHQAADGDVAIVVGINVAGAPLDVRLDDEGLRIGREGVEIGFVKNISPWARQKLVEASKICVIGITTGSGSLGDAITKNDNIRLVAA